MLSNNNEENLLNVIKDFRKTGANKRCANCGESRPSYVCTTYNTFVCNTCSGIHREFSHRVKSIAMSTFSKVEVDHILSGGNRHDQKEYLAHYNKRDFLPPNPGDINQIRKWIQVKYINKKWADNHYKREKSKVKKSEIHVSSIIPSPLFNHTNPPKNKEIDLLDLNDIFIKEGNDNIKQSSDEEEWADFKTAEENQLFDDEFLNSTVSIKIKQSKLDKKEKRTNLDPNVDLLTLTNGSSIKKNELVSNVKIEKSEDPFESLIPNTEDKEIEIKTDKESKNVKNDILLDGNDRMESKEDNKFDELCNLDLFSK